MTDPDLLRAPGRTRLLALWDQQSDQLISSSDINRALRTRDPLAALGYELGDHERDDAASIIARGAPGADLIFVDLAAPARVSTIRDAIELAAEIAGNRPWVAHLDVARRTSDALESMLDELARGPGRMIVCRAPRAAAAVARMYEAAGRPLSSDEIRRVLRDTATGDRRFDLDAAVTRVGRRPPPNGARAVTPAEAVLPTLAEAATPGIIPVRRVVHSAGIRLEAVDKKQTWIGGQDLAPQMTRVILTALVAPEALTDHLVAEATPIIRNADWDGVNVNRHAHDKQLVNAFTVKPTLAFVLVSWLELVQNLTTTLSADEIGRVERAVAVSMVWARNGKTLTELYPWMSEKMLTGFGWSQRMYLDQLHMAIGTGKTVVFTRTPAGSPGWLAWREQTMIAIANKDVTQLPWSPNWTHEQPLQDAMTRLVDAWNQSITPFEAIRDDAALVKVDGYRYLWKVKEGQKATPKTRIDPNELRRFLTYAWQRRESWARDAVNDADARKKLLEAFARYSRVASKEGPAATPTGALSYSPGTANAPPLPSSLASSPSVSSPMYLIPVGAEIRANMVLQFPDVYEAFGNFGYRWELVKIPAATIDAAIDRGNDLGFTRTDDSDAPGLIATLGNQLDRRSGYAKEDVQRVFQSCDGWLGPAGVGAAGIVEVGAIAGFIGEVVSSFVEWITAKQDEKRIPLRDPGLFLLRCIATPQISEDADRIRPPSAAYLPLWVQSIEEVANNTATNHEINRWLLPLQIGKLRNLLAETTDPKEREEIEQEIKRLQLERGGSVDDILELAYTSLKKFIDETKTPDSPLSLKRAVEDSLQKASTQRDELLTRLMNRSKWRGQLDPYAPKPEDMTRLSGVMVTDDGVVIDLLTDTYRHPKSGDFYVFDSTKPQGGLGHAHADDPSVAIRKALKSVLDDSDHGYGRGQVTFYVTIDGAYYSQTFRTSPDLPAVLIHSLENTVQLATAVALIVVVASSGGVGVALLLPLAVIGAIPSVYRLVTKARDGELGLDLATLLDIVNVIGTLAGLGQAAAGALKLIKLSQGFMIMGLGADATGGILMSAQIADQIAMTASIQPPAARHAELVRIMSGAALTLGMTHLGKLAGHYAQARAIEAAGIEAARAPLDRAPLEVNNHLKSLVDADVPVFVDPEASPKAPMIHFEPDGYGLPHQLRVVLPEATPKPASVEPVARPLRSLLRMDELAGGIRRLADHVETLRTSKKAPPKKSRAGEAMRVIDDAPKQLTELADGVQKGTIAPDAADLKVAALRKQLEGAQMTLQELAQPDFVASQKPTETRAAAAGYDKAPKGHYVVENENGVFELRRAADSTDKPYHYDAHKRAVPGEAPAHPSENGPPSSRKKNEYDSAVTGAAAAQKLGAAVEFKKKKGQKDVRIRQKLDGGYLITVPEAKRSRASHADVMAAVEERLRLPPRPATPENGPASRRIKGRNALWSGEEEAQWRGYPPALDDHHWVWRGKDIEHIKQPGTADRGPSYRYDATGDKFVKRSKETPVITTDDPMEELGGNSPHSPFGLWVETVTGENGVLQRVLGMRKGEGLPRPDGKGPVTREYLRDQMGADPKGRKHTDALRDAKQHVQPQIEAAIRKVDALKKQPRYGDLWTKAAAATNPAMADLVVSHQALLDMTAKPQSNGGGGAGTAGGRRYGEGLHPLDAGRMANGWFFDQVAPRLVPENGQIVREVPIPADIISNLGLDPDAPMPRLDGVLVPPAAGVEVKHGRAEIIHSDPFIAEHNQRQWEVFSRLPGQSVKNDRFPGGELAMKAMQYALTHPEGVLTNVEWIADQLLKLTPQADFVLFDHERGYKVWTKEGVTGRARAGLTRDGLIAEIQLFINGSTGVAP